MYKTKVINLLGGPGTAKSTTAAYIFSFLKWNGVECEMALEFAKDKVWEESTNVLNNQMYIFGKQLHRMWRLNGKVEVIITDSPLMLSVIYGKDETEVFHQMVYEKFSEFDNINIVMERSMNYVTNGRLQTLEEAIIKDNEIKDMMDKYSIPYTTVIGSRDKVEDYCYVLLERIKNGKN